MNIKQHQRNLKHAGYYYTASIDGIAGEKTIAAYRAFQRDQKLAVDGICGPLTEAALLRYIQDVQERLNASGGYGLVVDGLVGEKTVQAIRAFQKVKKLIIDGIAGVETMAVLNGIKIPAAADIDWQTIKYLKKEEFKCECGGRYCSGYPAQLSKALVHILDTVRSRYGKPITITSGLRCVKQNAIDGGIVNSKHLYGKAADFWFSGMDKTAVIAYMRTLPGYSYAYTNEGNMRYAVHIEV